MIFSWIIHPTFWATLFNSYWVTLDRLWCHKQVSTNCQHTQASTEHTDYYTNETKKVASWEFILKGVKLGIILTQIKRMDENNKWQENLQHIDKRQL